MKYTQVVILCEDLQQSVFARTFLIECGVEPNRIRVAPLPKQGAGESFVKREYPNEVKRFRQRAHRMHIGLIVMIDADNRSVQDHFLELDQALRDEASCKLHVRKLARNRHQPLAAHAPESLKLACSELPRLFPEDA